MKNPWTLIQKIVINTRIIKIMVNHDTNELLFNFQASSTEGRQLIIEKINEALKAKDITPEYIVLDITNRN